MEKLKKIWICGLLPTQISIFVFRWLFTDFHINYMIANIIAIVLSNIFAFFGNKFLVFRHRCKDVEESFSVIKKYILTRVFSGLVDILGVLFAVEILLKDEVTTKCILQIVVIILNQVLEKNVVLKDRDVDRKIARRNKKL